MKTWMRYMAGAALLGVSQWSWALQVPGPVVDVQWLARNKAQVTLLDVRPDQKTFLTAARFEVDKKTGKQVLVELGGHIQDAAPVQIGRAHV